MGAMTAISSSARLRIRGRLVVRTSSASFTSSGSGLISTDGYSLAIVPLQSLVVCHNRPCSASGGRGVTTDRVVGTVTLLRDVYPTTIVRSRTPGLFLA